MRLLIVTQAVDADSSTLGFFIEWLKEFARRAESVEVFGFQVGRHDLPANVSVSSGGKESGIPIFGRLQRYWCFLWRALPRVDGVFIHMSPEYLIAGWPLFALRRRPIVLWYAHRQVSWRMRLGSILADRIATSAPRAYRLPSGKVTVVGQGVPTDVFSLRPRTSAAPRLVTVGRITPIKGLELMVDALALLRGKGIPATLDIIGEPVMPSDREYKEEVQEQIRRQGLEDAARFLGTLPFETFPRRYADYAVALNMAPTGAPDKAVLEAMSCGLPIVVVNETFRTMLGRDAESMVASPEARDVAEKIAGLLKKEDPDLPGRMREIVIKGHSVKNLVRGIMKLYEKNA